MRLESALYSGREGLTAHGQAIAVVGDNISNSNTTAFKTSRVEFSDILSTGPEGYASYVWGADTGSGVQVQAVRQLQEVGVIEATGRALDLGIGGQGFFLVGDSTNPNYTRAGNFSIDGSGNLTTAAGDEVLGYLGSDTTTLSAINMQSFESANQATSAATIFGNVASDSPITVAPTNPATFREMASGASYVSNYSVYDTLGSSHDVSLAFYKTAPSTWTVQAYMDAGDTGGAEGTPVQLGQNLALTFQGSGVLSDADKANAVIQAAPTYSNGATAGSFSINLSGFTQFAGTSQLASVTQDGIGAGSVDTYEFETDGDIYAQLDNGARSKIGSLPLATFANLEGLERGGNGLFREGESSGTRTIGTAGAATLGEIESASLERSTVDIANQFVDLVVFQRGYQASSQALSTASGMIRDTLQLIR